MRLALIISDFRLVGHTGIATTRLPERESNIKGLGKLSRFQLATSHFSKTATTLPCFDLGQETFACNQSIINILWVRGPRKSGRPRQTAASAFRSRDAHGDVDDNGQGSANQKHDLRCGESIRGGFSATHDSDFRVVVLCFVAANTRPNSSSPPEFLL